MVSQWVMTPSRTLEDPERFVVQLLDNGAGCPRWYEQTEPDRIFGVGVTRFLQCRYVGQRRRSLCAVYCQREQLALPDMGEHQGDRPEEEVDPARDHLKHCFRAALERERAPPGSPRRRGSVRR